MARHDPTLPWLLASHTRRAAQIAIESRRRHDNG
jgi:hypothetical protein